MILATRFTFIVETLVKKNMYFHPNKLVSKCARGMNKQREGDTWVNVCWVCVAGVSKPLPHYSLFCGQL